MIKYVVVLEDEIQDKVEAKNKEQTPWLYKVLFYCYRYGVGTALLITLENIEDYKENVWYNEAKKFLNSK